MQVGVIFCLITTTPTTLSGTRQTDTDQLAIKEEETVFGIPVS